MPSGTAAGNRTLPTLAALLLLALDLAIVNRRAWWAAATFPIAALATLMHSAFATLAPLLLAPASMLALGRRWLALTIGVATTLLLAVPFVVYEFQINWKDYPNFRYYSSLRTFVDLDALRWLVSITTGWNLPSDGVVPPPQRVLPRVVVDVGADVALALLVGGTLLAVFEIARWQRSGTSRPTRFRLTALVLCLVLPGRAVHTPLAAAVPALFPGVVSGGVFANGLRVRAPIPHRQVRRAGRGSSRRDGLDRVDGGRNGVRSRRASGRIPASCRRSPPPARRLSTSPNWATPPVAMPPPSSWMRATPKPWRICCAPISRMCTCRIRSRRARPQTIRQRRPWNDAPTQALHRGASGPPSVLTATQAPQIRFPNGVTLRNVAFSAQAGTGQYLQLAMVWSVDAAADSIRPVVWRAVLQDAAGETVQRDSGDSVFPATLRGQSVVSWFSIDTRREVAPAERAPGNYQLGLELVDTFGDPPLGLPFTDPTGNSARMLQLPVAIGPFSPCEFPTTIP